VTNYLNNKSRRAAGSKRPSGNTGLNILMFVAAAILIMGLVIAYEKGSRKRGPAEQPEPDGSVEVLPTDEDYTKRGLRPNTTPEPPVVEPTPNTQPTPTPDPIPPMPTYKFIGRSDWNRYHRPECKYAQRTPEDKRVYFASAEEAWSKGYIPCKICKPEAPNAETPRPVSTTPRPVQRTEKPISLPIEDVSVSFPYRVVERDEIVEKAVIRIEITAEVEKPLQKKDILRLAQKLVAAETRKKPINAVSIIMQKKTTLRDSLKWVCWVDWAPYGNLVRASEVTAGDYRTHQFDVFQHGTLRLKN